MIIYQHLLTIDFEAMITCQSYSIRIRFEINESYSIRIRSDFEMKVYSIQIRSENE